MSFAALGLVAQLARTAPEEIAVASTTTLHWTAPEGCPSAVEVAQWIDDAPGGAPIVAAITVRRIEKTRWEVEVEIGEGSRRTIAGESCVAVTRAAVVVVALARGAVPEPEPTSVVIEDPPRDDPSRDDPSPVVAPAPPRAPIDLRLAAGALLGGGALPRIAGGIHGGLALEGWRWWLEIGATHWFRSFAARPTTPTAGVSIASTHATLEGGPRFAWKRLAFVLGAAVELGAITARPAGAERRTPDRRAWLAAGGRTGLHWRVRPWLGLGLEAAVVAPMIRGRYVVGGTLVHQIGRVAAHGGAVVQFIIPLRRARPRS